MSEENRTEDGINIESVQSAYCNMQTFANMISGVKTHPIFQMALEQIKNGLGKHADELEM